MAIKSLSGNVPLSKAVSVLIFSLEDERSGYARL